MIQVYRSDFEDSLNKYTEWDITEIFYRDNDVSPNVYELVNIVNKIALYEFNIILV